jgi:hypothetical protein
MKVNIFAQQNNIIPVAESPQHYKNVCKTIPDYLHDLNCQLNIQSLSTADQKDYGQAAA